MKIKIVTKDNALAIEVGASLEATDCAVSLENAAAGYQLWVREGLALGEVQAIRKAILPFDPAVATDPSLADSDLDALLCLGFESDARTSRFDVEIASAAPELAAGITGELQAIGFPTKLLEPLWHEQDVVAFGTDVPLFTRHRILWLLRQRGIVPRHADGGVADDGIALILRPAAGRATARQFVPLEVRCDDPALLASLQANGLAGFRVIHSDKTPKNRFLFALGPLRSTVFAAERLALQQAILDLLAAEGVDPDRHPIKSKSSKDLDEPVAARCTLHLPIRAWRSGEIRTYAGDYPDRLEIELLSDDDTGLTAPLATLLREQGFLVVERPLADSMVSAGFKVAWAMAEVCPQQKQRIGDTLRLFMQDHALPAGHRLAEEAGNVKEPMVRIAFPIYAALAGTLPDHRGAGYDFKLHCEHPASWEEALRKLRTWGFDTFRTDSSRPSASVTGRGATIRYGGAPRVLIEEIADLFRREAGPIQLEKVWHDRDTDIWVEVDAHPGYPVTTERESKPVSRPPVSRVPPPGVHPEAAIEVGDGFVRVGGYRLPRRTDVPPDHPLLVHVDTASFCLDAPTMAIVKHLATSIHLGQHVLLEGDTSTSKTSTVLYVANLLNQPVVELNLNGQSDTGELVGRYAPSANESTQKGLIKSVLHAFYDKLLGNKSTWKWLDGAVIQAIKARAWLVLSEVNLADPQVLERLNSLLERNARLLLSERDCRLIAGDQIHPSFLVFATMNPSTYAGRVVLSPAWRDRFGGYRYVPVPEEQDFLAMLRYLVFGEQPAVLLDDHWVRGERSPVPPYAALAEQPGIEQALQSLARFHASVIGASGQDGESAAKLGTHRKERHVFTRRGLFNVMDFLMGQLSVDGDRPFSLGDAIERAITCYYVNHMDHSSPDRDTVRALQEANGLTAALMEEARKRTKQAEANARHGLLARLSATLCARAEQLARTNESRECRAA